MGICYSDEASRKDIGYYTVTFIVNTSGARLTRGFDSEQQARAFVNKLRHSKRCTLTACPVFK